jgi:hypothetical protein
VTDSLNLLVLSAPFSAENGHWNDFVAVANAI